MLSHAIPELTKSRGDLANSVTLGEVARLMHLPLPVQARLTAARVGLQRMAPRDVLYRSGDPFESLHVVLSGLLKLAAVGDDGQEQVFAFVLSGEAAGLDGFQGGSHCVDATALDAVHVALVPFAKLERQAEFVGERELGEQLVHRILAQGMVHVEALWLLSTLDARTRVAAFLLSLGKRLQRVHAAAAPLDFPMTDAEIGSYLRLPRETVGSVLREFVEAGLIEVVERGVSLVRLAGLAALVEHGRRAHVSHSAAPD